MEPTIPENGTPEISLSSNFSFGPCSFYVFVPKMTFSKNAFPRTYFPRKKLWSPMDWSVPKTSLWTRNSKDYSQEKVRSEAFWQDETFLHGFYQRYLQNFTAKGLYLIELKGPACGSHCGSKHFGLGYFPCVHTYWWRHAKCVSSASKRTWELWF